MKEKLLYLILALTILFSSCNDFLDVKNVSKVDNEFVFQSEIEANKLVMGAYELLKGSGIHSNNLFYAIIGVASDYEIGPELVTSNPRYNNENFYPLPVNVIDGGEIKFWDTLYKAINRCNIIMAAFEESPAYQAAKAAGVPSVYTHMYGEIAVMRAIFYYELTRLWGDVIYTTAPIDSKEDYEVLSLTDRCTVQEGEIAKLKEVESLMFYMNEQGYTAERLTRGAAYAMIAKLALIRGGYALHPADADMADYETPIQSHPEWGKMARRTDWKEWYKEANKYLKLVRDHSGASLITDDKGTGNAFQQIFQQQMNLQISQESIFEVSQTAGSSTERPYAFGRPSSGGGTAYPPKAYGQIRFLPWFYWGAFNEKDLRKDVTVAVTGLSGAGTEILIPWLKGNVCNGGGIGLNKWDYSRLTNLGVTAASSRKSGVNATYIRLADMLLLLAETEAVLAREGEAGYSVQNAITELEKVRSRAFAPEDRQQEVTAYLTAINTPEAAFEAVQNERMFELAGEGQRKYDLVRWGILGEKVNEVQKEMESLLSDLENQKYHEYENGNQFPAYVYTKEYTKAEAEALGLNDILIGQTPRDLDPDSELYALQHPGWRGNTDRWESERGAKGLNYKSMAIRGLFRYIPEGSAEHNELIAQGYQRVPYGIRMLYNETGISQKNNWNASKSGIFGGYLPADHASNYPPRYIIPIPSSAISYSNYQITNNYGFPNE